MPLLSSCGSIQGDIAARLNEVSATESPNYLTWINETTHDLELQLVQTGYGRYLEGSADFTTSASTYIYALTAVSADIASMYSIIDPVNNRKLSYITKQEFDSLYPSASNVLGTPTSYTIYNEQLYFGPTPNASITHHYSYQKYLGDVSAESAVMPIPNRFLEMYVYRGIQIGLERRGDYQNAQLFEKRYQTKVEQMIKALKDLGMKRIKSAREFRPNFTSDPIKNAIWNA